MRKRLLILTIGVSLLAFTGCGKKTDQPAEEAVAEDTSFDDDDVPVVEEAEEPADTEEPETEAVDITEASAETEDNDLIPADFLQEQSGLFEFADYEDVISNLKEGQGYAYIKMYGSDDELLAVTDLVFEADHSAGSMSLYHMNDGKALNMSCIGGNGSAYPLRLEDGIVYAGDNHTYETYFLNEAGAVMQKDYVTDGINDGSQVFSGFTRDTNDYDHDKDFEGGEDEFLALLSERETKPFIVFTVSGEEIPGTELPAYEYPGPELFYYELYTYLTDELSRSYDKADVSIPCPVIEYIDESDDDDIKVYGDFLIFNYNLNRDILECMSGGSYPGVVHMKKTDEGYEVSGMDVVADGSDYTPSAKKIFGDRYEKVIAVIGDDELRERTRAQIIANYVALNGLDINAYKDYGWDPVSLPPENIDTFYSDL